MHARVRQSLRPASYVASAGQAGGSLPAGEYINQYGFAVDGQGVVDWSHSPSPPAAGVPVYDDPATGIAKDAYGNPATGHAVTPGTANTPATTQTPAAATSFFSTYAVPLAVVGGIGVLWLIFK